MFDVGTYMVAHTALARQAMAFSGQMLLVSRTVASFTWQNPIQRVPWTVSLGPQPADNLHMRQLGAPPSLVTRKVEHEITCVQNYGYDASGADRILDCATLLGGVAAQSYCDLA